jgi:hypothetical protein
VEYHGWAALGWITYFHYALLIGLIICLAWANSILSMPLGKRVAMNALAASYGMFIFYALVVSLGHFYMPGFWSYTIMGWEAIRLFGWWEEPEVYFQMSSILVVAPLLMLGVILILRLYGFIVNRKDTVKAIGLMFLSTPLAMFFLWIVNHKGGPNLIHAIKSGFIIPFIVFSVGYLVLKAKSKLVD